MTIYEKIRKRRIELGMSQQELAMKTGYQTRGAINRIESGCRDISQSKIMAFATALDLPIAFLLNDNQTFNDLNNELKTENLTPKNEDTPLLNIYHRLNARGKEKVLDYASDLAKSPDYTTAPAHPYRIAARGGGVMDLTEEEYKKRCKELEDAVVATPETHPWL